jgi:glutamyl/glutaminyl-tRNA synthetase
VWHHHPLCRDASGRRLAKRDNDTAIRALRQSGLSADDVRVLAAAMAEGSVTAATGRSSNVRDGERVGLDP